MSDMQANGFNLDYEFVHYQSSDHICLYDTIYVYDQSNKSL